MDRKEKGDGLTAAEWNDLSDRVEAIAMPSSRAGVRTRTDGRGGISISGDLASLAGKEAALIAVAHNDGAEDLPAFSPAEIIGNFYEDMDEFFHKRALVVQLPTDGSEGFIVVTAEPIPAGRAGRVFVLGMFPVQVSGEIEDRAFVDISSGNSYAVANDEGCMQVLWQESGDALRMALVRFGGAGAGAGAKRVRVVARSVVTLSGSQTVDSVALSNNDLVLVTANGSSQNGIWKVQTSGAWIFQSRPMLVVIAAGTLNAQTAWFRVSDPATYVGLGAYWK